MKKLALAIAMVPFAAFADGTVEDQVDTSGPKQGVSEQQLYTEAYNASVAALDDYMKDLAAGVDTTTSAAAYNEAAEAFRNARDSIK